jgi:hypothetical protein
MQWPSTLHRQLPTQMATYGVEVAINKEEL